MLLLLVLAASSHAAHLGAAVGLTPYAPISALYHSQDSLGQYVYGYATPTASKTETKTADGVTRGGYSYLDSNGLLQTVHYVADPYHGFRVAATNLPQDLPEVAHAKAKHLEDFARIATAAPSLPQDLPEVAQAKAKHLEDFARIASAAPSLPQDLPEVAQAKAKHLEDFARIAAAAPSLPQDLPEVAAARAEHLEAVAAARAAHLSPVRLTGNVAAVRAALPVAQVSTQYHAQDGLGQYSYGYVGPWSAKSEARGADGVTRGGYSYIDANGVLQTVTYVADDVNGFRVAASNLPEVIYY